MLIADPNKIAAVREIIDAEVAMLVVDRGLERPRAYIAVAAEQLRHNLVIKLNHSGWWSCIAIHVRHYERRPSGEMPKNFSAIDVARFALERTVVARSPEIAVLGAMLRVLDDKIDIWLDPADFEVHYGRQAWLDVASVNPFGVEISDDPNQLLLGESDEEYEARRKATLVDQAVRKMQEDLVFQTLGITPRSS